MLYDTAAKTIRYLDPSVYLDAKPVWSPDGTKIAFLRRLTGGHAFGLNMKDVSKPDPWEVRVADLADREDGGARGARPDDDSFYFADLAWFDDEQLVFRSERDGWRHLYLVGADGDGLVQLTSGEYEVEAFEPGPQQGRVYLTCNRDDLDRRHIWSVDAAGRWHRSPVGPPSSGRRFRLPTGRRWPTWVRTP